MNLDKLFNIAASIVTLAMIAVVVKEGGNTAKVIGAVTDGFAGAISAAKK